MTIHRFFQDIEASNGHIDPAEAHHMRRVLRLTPGDSVMFSDGNGTEWDCVIRSFDPDMVEIQDKRTLPFSDPKITLVISAIKPANLELILEKGTELGVDQFVITKTDFSQIPLDKLTKKQDRFEKILVSATKQCERGFIPKLNIVPVSELDSWKSQVNLIGTTQYIDDPELLTKIDLGESVTLFIGPEGGFSEDEYRQFEQDFTPVTFGLYVLRSETAAIAGVTILAQQKLTNIVS